MPWLPGRACLTAPPGAILFLGFLPSSPNAGEEMLPSKTPVTPLPRRPLVSRPTLQVSWRFGLALGAAQGVQGDVGGVGGFLKGEENRLALLAGTELPLLSAAFVELDRVAQRQAAGLATS